MMVNAHIAFTRKGSEQLQGDAECEERVASLGAAAEHLAAAERKPSSCYQWNDRVSSITQCLFASND